MVAEFNILVPEKICMHDHFCFDVIKTRCYKKQNEKEIAFLLLEIIILLTTFYSTGQWGKKL